MTDKEISLRSVLFLVIGILLLLSLFICIFIIGSESDLVKVDAVVTNVTKDAKGTGKNDVMVTYDVDGTSYDYEFYYDEDVNVDDTITIYYHSKNATSIEFSKTSKLIFICPIIGLGLCGYGLYELFKKGNKNSDGEEEFKTTTINVIKDKPEPQVTEVNVVQNTEQVEVPEVKTTMVVNSDVKQEASKDATVAQESNEKNMVSLENVKIPNDVVGTKTAGAIVSSGASTPAALASVLKEEPKLENAVVENVSSNNKVSLDEDEIRKVIKDVLKEVLLEAKDEEKPVKKAVIQKKVIPNYYYISGTSLVFEEAGKDSQEMELKTINSVTKTINKDGNVVKLVVSSEKYKCVLTNMKNIDLEQVANLLHNKMRTIDENFKEKIENKEF